MSFNDFKAFFSQLFTALDTKDSLLILLFLLVAFLIGWLFGRLSLRSKYRKLQKAYNEKETELITLNANYTALKEKYEMREEELKAARTELEEFEAAHRKLESEKGKLSGDLYLANDQLDQLKIANNQFENKIITLNATISELQEQLEQQQTAQPDEIEEVDLETLSNITEIQSNYQGTISRLAAIEDKLNLLEIENSDLKSKLESFRKGGEALTLPAISESEEESSEEKATKARLEINNALGNRIAKVAASDADDLKLINGIGPFIEGKLNEIGIYSFRQISQFDDELITLVTDAIQFFPGRIHRDKWVEQARAFL